jgi:hypothetical protein
VAFERLLHSNAEVRRVSRAFGHLSIRRGGGDQGTPYEQTLAIHVPSVRGGPGCLNNFSASISGASAGVRLPSGAAAS